MLSKMKSPSLIERRSPIVHGNNSESDQQQSADEAQTNEDDDLESQHTATDLIIDQQVEDDVDDDKHVKDEREEHEPSIEKKSHDDDDDETSVRQFRVDRNSDRNDVDDEEVTNDNNNNINNNLNNNNNNLENSPRSIQQQQQQQQQNQQNGKKSQNELMGIIETSRKRRLSKDSADSLTSFIRWSFSHFDAVPNSKLQSRRKRIKEEDAEREADDEDEPDQVRANVGRHEHEEVDDIQDDEDEAKNLTIVTDEAAQADREDSTQERHPKQEQPQRAEMKFATERVLRNRATRLGSSGSAGQQASNTNNTTTTNNNNNNGTSKTSLTNESPIKRALGQSAIYSPEPQLKAFSAAAANHDHHHQQQQTNGFRKSSPQSNGNNVADRLHQSQQQQQRHIKSLDHIANQLTRSGSNQFNLATDELGADELPTNGLSLQLQQFLQQQQKQQHGSVLDELMLNQEELSPGAGNRQSQSNQQQLALAAAIHRALLGNAGSGQQAAAANGNELKSNGAQQHAISSGANGQQNGAGQQLGGFLADSLNRQHQRDQQRPRAYNTRGLAQAAANLASNRLQQQQMAISNRVAMIQQQQQHQQQQQQQQQQRHAQAAAALSVLANGAHPAALHHFAAAAAAAAANQPPQPAGHHHHHHLLHNHHNQQGSAAAAAAAAAALQQRQQQHLQQPGAGGQPGQPTAASLAALANQTEFKCDTCPSSFDDRHRLMQHQSIHLELKKDWFTETPVEEVMKIFNRRRGEFLCNLCNLRFEATLDYDQHNHQVHGPRPYCCQFCGNGTRTFKCWRQYLNHLYDHRYIFSCTIGDCDFTVNRRDSLRFHIFRFHLNCQLPQNQLVTPTNGLGHHHNKYSASQLSPYNLSQNGGFGMGDSDGPVHFGGSLGAALQQQQQKWSHMGDLDEDEDTENEMNVAD